MKNNFQRRIAITLAEYLVKHTTRFDKVPFLVITTMILFIKCIQSKNF